MVNRLLIIFMLFVCGFQPTYAATSKEGALQFEIPMVQGTEKYLELLAFPSYLVVALENNGIKTSNMGRPTLIDERTVQFKSAILHFAEKKGTVYSYKGSLEWDIPLKHLKFEVPVEIDTASISKGTIQVNVFVPLAKLFPDTLVERIRMKIQSLSGPEVQKQMTAYFDDISKKSESMSGLQGMFAKIMLQSYSAPAESYGACVTHEPGDAESLSDQIYLLVTLAIWLIVVPVTIVTFVFWRKCKNKNQK
ncbi:hypothetical protein GALL_437140 [mine drainage metagenome]|uniref:Uncharacterized protein n=1 Tax=mine drainage metagenome TaxID=410659 RepID=A0A1J5Q3R8_9ZZZZ